MAPAQVGTNGKGNHTYGHSMVVSPWGDVLLDMGKDESVATIDIDLDLIKQAEKQVAAWSSRREDLFPIA
jgi:predicted amidohydrolase